MSTFSAKTLVASAALAATLVTAAPAAADTLVASAPGARSLTAGGGWLAWVTPAANGKWQITLRSSAGTVWSPKLAGFDDVPTLSIGSQGFTRGQRSRHALLVYSRDGDVYEYDLVEGVERRVAALATRAWRETAPSVSYGSYAFSRIGRRGGGTYVTTRGGRLRKLSSQAARETAHSGSRVAWTNGSRVLVKRASGEGAMFSLRSPGRPAGLSLTRYRLGWLVPGEGQVFMTARFAGSGGPYPAPDRAQEGNRRLPGTTNSLGLRRGEIGYYLDAEGVKRVEPNLFR